MKVINKSDHKFINSSTCGELIELINDPKVPVSITKAEDIKPTVCHAHKESTELYWVVKGSVEIEIGTNQNFKVVKLKSNSILVIEPGEFHRIVKASEKNTILVLSNPPWSPDDEILMK